MSNEQPSPGSAQVPEPPPKEDGLRTASAAPSLTFVDSGSITFDEGAASAGFDQYGGGFSNLIDVRNLDAGGKPDPGAVTLTYTSSDPALIPDYGLSYAPGGSNPNLFGFYLDADSSPGQFGSATVTLTASNGTTSATEIVPVRVREVALPPLITSDEGGFYHESSATQTVSIPVTITPVNGAAFTTQLSTPAAVDGWSAPTLVTGPGGNDSIVFTVAPDVDAPGAVVLTATAEYGGRLQDVSATQTIAVGANQSAAFSVPATQSFSLPEDDGVAVLSGIGRIPVTGDAGDNFTFTVLSGDPPVSPGSTTPLYTVGDDNGIIFPNSLPPWQKDGGNATTLDVRVSNGVVSHDDKVTVRITDASPPLLAISAQAATPGHDGKIIATASDPHGLAVRIAITGQTDGSGHQAYAIAGSHSSDGTLTATILVDPNAPLAGVSDSMTLTATDSQGLSTSELIDFYPDALTSASPTPAFTAAVLVSHAGEHPVVPDLLAWHHWTTV